ncbi:hypothetical protein [Thermoleptolyngbya sp. C42_A2020_037]|uniref:hypothetical protein n=1 Tax=Thermoleptolyngbya sp. C42_A2020_037 TaxID=2747799 RepID=UPI0019FFB79D|nr:hypothetical protein [Thermoleptolyngbya sp. C42_A2020_037]MBF2083673.1 hypothetical protein [Thermoleptolyngbya sp. C42_A2020_037]
MTTDDDWREDNWCKDGWRKDGWRKDDWSNSIDETWLLKLEQSLKQQHSKPRCDGYSLTAAPCPFNDPSMTIQCSNNPSKRNAF